MTTLLRLTSRSEVTALEDSRGATLFKVLEGPGRWVWTVESTDTPPRIEDSEPGITWYGEIFAAADARPFTQSAQYLYKIEIDVHPEIDLDDFHAWYNGTHVPEVGPAGLVRGRRFRALGHDRRFLATYDMTDRFVMDSAALARVRGFARFSGGVTIRSRRVLERLATS